MSDTTMSPESAMRGPPLPNAEWRALAARIGIVLFDVDGVMTDGGLFYGPGGEVMKRFHVHDGHGAKQLIRAGIVLVAISGRRSDMTARRLEELGFAAIEQGNDDKLSIAERLLTRFGFGWSSAAAIGDDLPDLPLLERAALAVAPANAVDRVRRTAHWVTTLGGGQGAVREFADGLLAARSEP